MESLHVEKNEQVLIIGSGPVGLLHLLLLKEKGAQVTVMDKHESKLKVATKLGADFVMLSKIQNLSHDPGFDYVFECTGMPEVWEASVTYVRRGGTVVLFGGCKSGTTVTYDTERLHYDEITIKGVFHYTPADVKKAYKLLCKKNVNVSRLISGRFSLKQTHHLVRAQRDA